MFLAACEDGLVPYRRAGAECDLDEERRLLYVGMTRAKQVLYITGAGRRTLFGHTEERQPSPFLREVEAGLRDHIFAAARRKRPSGQQLEFGF